MAESLPEVVQQTLPNGSQLYSLKSERQGLTRIVIRFDSTPLFANHTTDAQILFQLLKSGTKDKELFRFVTCMEATGMMLSCYSNADSGVVEAVILDEQLPNALPLLFEMITTPALPQDEFARIRQIAVENWHIARRQTHVVARERFMESIFSNHPYGKVPTIEQIEGLTQATASTFHQKMLNGISPLFFVASAQPKKVVETIGQTMALFPELKGETTLLPEASDCTPMHHANGQPTHLEVQDTVQSSIRMGRVLFNQTHDDYTVGKVATTILGGYFSSRLMANLREDKGYTYGVGAGIHTFASSGYLSVSAEVGTQHLENALSEIHQEIEKLRKEPVDSEELHVVKQYLRGNTLRSIDGSFTQLNLIASLQRKGLDAGFTRKYLRVIEQITPQDILNFAKQWLNPAEMVTITAGAQKMNTTTTSKKLITS